jgi:hypothetical protein
MPPRVITPSGLSDNTIGYFAPHQRYPAAVRAGQRAEDPTGGPAVLALRARQSRPILTTPADVLRDPPPGRESALSTVGVMPAAAWRACLVPAPAELSMVGTTWKVLVHGHLGAKGRR